MFGGLGPSDGPDGALRGGRTSTTGSAGGAELSDFAGGGAPNPRLPPDLPAKPLSRLEELASGSLL